MTDLFLNKSQQLLNFCKTKRLVSKADIISWGLSQYYLRAEREVRRFVEKGLMRSLSKDECIFRNLKGRMSWYEVR